MNSNIFYLDHVDDVFISIAKAHGWQYVIVKNPPAEQGAASLAEPTAETAAEQPVEQTPAEEPVEQTQAEPPGTASLAEPTAEEDEPEKPLGPSLSIKSNGVITGPVLEYTKFYNLVYNAKTKGVIPNVLKDAFKDLADNYHDSNIQLHQVIIEKVIRDKKQSELSFVIIKVGFYNKLWQLGWQIFCIHTHYTNIGTIKYYVSRLTEKCIEHARIPFNKLPNEINKLQPKFIKH